MQKFKNIIFDCDGVLVDSEIIANRIEAEFKTQLGLPTTIEQQILKFVGLSVSDPVVQEELSKLPVDYLERVDSLIQQAYQKELKAVKGVLQFMEAHDIPKCVASNSEPEWLEFKLTFTHLKKYFPDAIFSSRLVKRGKPAPDLFLYAAEKMGWNISECLVVEDSVAGVKAALAAGMTVCGFVGGLHIMPGHREKLVAAGANRVVSEFNEIEKLI